MKYSLFIIAVFCLSQSVYALDTVNVKIDGKTKTLIGRIETRSPSGHLSIQTRDGQCYILAPDEIIDESSDERSFVPMTMKEMTAALETEFLPLQQKWRTKFGLHTTKNYVIVYNTSQAYAQWMGLLFESLLKSYQEILRKSGFPVEKIEFPLVAVLFSHRDYFAAYAKADIQEDAPDSLLAYYHKWTNRVVLCDLSGIESNFDGAGGRINLRTVESYMSRPGVKTNISAVLHEAVHQIGFNNGVHHRFAPCPLWVCEALALLFETPVPATAVGKATGIQWNANRYSDLEQYMRQSPNDPIRKLIEKDSPLTKGTLESIRDAYALTWGLAYFLNQKRPKEWVAYLKSVSEKQPFTLDTPEKRLEEFESFFGVDWPKLYKEMALFYRQH